METPKKQPEVPIFETSESPNFKYKPVYAVQLYKHIMGGGSFESFSCGEEGKPPITRKTKQNWYNTIPEFAHARHQAEAKLQGNVDRLIFAGALGIVQKAEMNDKGEITSDPKLQNTKLLMFLAKTRFRNTYMDKSEMAVMNPDGSKIGQGYTMEELAALSDEELDMFIKLTEKINSEKPAND